MHDAAPGADSGADALSTTGIIGEEDAREIVRAHQEAGDGLSDDGRGDPTALLSDVVPADKHMPGLPGLPLPGQRAVAAEAGECSEQPPSEGRALSGLWVPVRRQDVAKLTKERPELLRLYFRLRDETYRAQWRYGQDYQDGIYFRGLFYEWIIPHTFLFDLGEFAPTVGLSPCQLHTNLKRLFALGYLDALHFGVQFDDEVTSVEGFGLPVSTLLGPGWGYDHEIDWTPTAVYIEPLTGGFVRMPKEAGLVSAGMLRLLAWLYLHATFRSHLAFHHRRSYHLVPGDVLASFADLGRELDEDRRQVSRWAGYALRDGLLLKIPEDRDDLWKVRTYATTLAKCHERFVPTRECHKPVFECHKQA